MVSIFENELLLRDMLIEFEDLGLTYEILYGGQTISPITENKFYSFMDAGDRNFGWSSIDKISYVSKSYVVSFNESIMENIVASDRKHYGREYHMISDRFFKIIQLAQNVKNKLEQYGHIVLISFESFERRKKDTDYQKSSNRFSIMVIEK